MHRASAAKLSAPLAVFCLLVGTSGAAPVSTSPVPVKASSRNELSPSAGGGFFTWAKSRRGHPHVYDVWGQQEGQAAFKINAPGTSGFGGGIDGTRLVYQQIKRFDSDLRFFDLPTRRRSIVSFAINTRHWEWGPTVSGDWLLFTRGGSFERTQQVILWNLGNGEQRILDTRRGTGGGLASGQVSGNFAVWSKCSAKTCDVFRYDIAAATKTAMPRNGRLLYAPSVVPSGATYYVSGESTCGGVDILKTTLDGTTFVEARTSRSRDIDSTYAVVLPGRPPNEQPGARIYFESERCSNNRTDIYSTDDVEPVPPPG